MKAAEPAQGRQGEPWTVELVAPGGESRVSFPCLPRVTVADAAESAGVAMTVVCANAGCGACRVRLHSGVIAYDRPVSQKKRLGSDGGYELACAAVPRSDVVLEPLRGWRLIDATPLSCLTRTARPR
jgi:ferredoxin